MTESNETKQLIGMSLCEGEFIIYVSCHDDRIQWN